MFSSQNFVILLIIFGCFWRIDLPKSCAESTFWLVVFSSVVRDGQVTTYLHLAHWNVFYQSLTKFTFLSTVTTTLRWYAESNWYSRVCSRCKPWIYKLVRQNRTKYLLIIDDSFEEICISKTFVDIATAGKHCGLSAIYIKHNLFHESKLGRDVELQNTYILLAAMWCKWLRLMHYQGSDQSWWTGIETQHFFLLRSFIDGLSPPTDNRLHYKNKYWVHFIKFFFPRKVEAFKFFG